MVWSVYDEISVSSTTSVAWSILLDVDNWKAWDVDLRDSHLTSASKVVEDGAPGELTMKNGRTFAFTLHSLQPERFFAYKTPLPGCVLDWTWEIIPSGNEGAFTFKEGVVGSGWASGVYKLLFAGACREAFKKCLVEFKTLAESKSAVSTS